MIVKSKLAFQPECEVSVDGEALPTNDARNMAQSGGHGRGINLPSNWQS